MTYRGLVRGNMIELEEALPYPDGQPINISIEPLAQDAPLGSPQLVLGAVRSAPHLTSEDMDELERAIDEGRLAVRDDNLFDAGNKR